MRACRYLWRSGAALRRTAAAAVLVAAVDVPAGQMVWKIVSPAGMLSASVYHDLKACKKALPRFKRGSVCMAVPAGD